MESFFSDLNIEDILKEDDFSSKDVSSKSVKSVKSITSVKSVNSIVSNLNQANKPKKNQLLYCENQVLNNIKLKLKEYSFDYKNNIQDFKSSIINICNSHKGSLFLQSLIKSQKEKEKDFYSREIWKVVSKLYNKDVS